MSSMSMSGFAAEGTKAGASKPYYLPNTGNSVAVQNLDVSGTLTFTGETSGLDMNLRPATLSGLNIISGNTQVNADMTMYEGHNFTINYNSKLQLATSIGSVGGSIGLQTDSTDVLAIQAVGDLSLGCINGDVISAVTGTNTITSIVGDENAAISFATAQTADNNVRVVPFLSAGGFNPNATNGDQAIIYGENVAGRTGLSILPWDESLSSGGMRLDPACNVNIFGNLSLASAAASAGLFTAAAVEVEGSFVIGNVRIVYGRTNNTDGNGDTAYVFANAFAAGTIPYVVASVYGASDLTSEISVVSNTGFTFHAATLGATGASGVSGFFFAVGQVA